jgi:hypothetical protein
MAKPKVKIEKFSEETWYVEFKGMFSGDTRWTRGWKGFDSRKAATEDAEKCLVTWPKAKFRLVRLVETGSTITTTWP